MNAAPCVGVEAVVAVWLVPCCVGAEVLTVVDRVGLLWLGDTLDTAVG